MFRSLMVLLAVAPQTVSPLIADVIACRAVEPAEARRLCFDAASERLETASREGGLVVIDPAAAEAARRNAFGLGLDAAEQGQPMEALNGVLKSARALPGEGFGRFELADGSVWRQISGAPWSGAKPGAQVRITRGAVGSYWIRIGDHPPVKAHRDL